MDSDPNPSRRLPGRSIDLIRELNQEVPARPPSLKDPDRKVWFEAGRRALVEELMARIGDDDELRR